MVGWGVQSCLDAGGAAGGFTQSRQVDDKRGAFAWFAAHCDLASVVPVLKRASGCGPGMAQRDRLWSILARTAWDTRKLVFRRRATTFLVSDQAGPIGI